MDQDLSFLAPLYGAGVIIFYAFGRFNEATYDTRMEFKRLNALLSVSRMRTASVMRLSFLYYTTGLVVIYLLVSAYMILFAENLPKSDPATIGGIAPGPVQKAMGDSGMVFLVVALAVVGIGPNIPFVRNVEAWLRRSAHGLAGIPTRVLAHTRELREKDFSLTPEDRSNLLLPEDRAVLDRLPRSNSDLLRDVSLIAAAGAWILNTRSIVGDSRLHDVFGKLEDELRHRKNEFFQALGEETGPDPSAKRSDLDRMSKPDIATIAKADELADDICVLLALYHEHRLLEEPSAATAGGPHLSISERRRRLVGEFVGRSETRSDEQWAEHAMLAISWTFGVILVLSVVWSTWPGVWEQQVRYPDDPQMAGVGWWRRVIERANDGLFTLFLPVAFGIGLWQGSKTSGNWGEGLDGHWTKALPRALMIFGGGWAIATFFLCGISFWQSALKESWSGAAQELSAWLTNSFTYQAPRAVTGALLAILVVGCLDRCQKKGASGLLTIRWWHTLLAALLVGLAGGVTRLQTILSLDVSETLWPGEYRVGAVVYAALYTTLVSFCVFYALSSTLRARHAPKHQEVALPSNTIITVLAMLFCVLPTALAAQSVRIAVREDARPYIWTERDSQSGTLVAKGYLWEVCALITVNAALTPIVVGVDASDRALVLDGKPSDIDLLCDPTTVTLKRITDFASTNLRFLPIFHLANRGYLERIPVKQEEEQNWLAAWWNRCSAKLKPTEVEMGAETQQNADKSECLRLRLSGKAIPEEVPFLRVSVAGTTSAHALSITSDCRDNNTADCLFVNSHAEAATTFCTSDRPIRYYGDVELIFAAVRSWDQQNPAKREEKPCAPERTSDPEGYEPYALVVAVNSQIPDLDRRLTLELYRLAHDGRLSALLRSHFPTGAISPDQESLFRILSIPAGVDPGAQVALSANTAEASNRKSVAVKQSPAQ